MKSTMRVLSGLLALVLVGLGLVWVAPHEGRPAPAPGRAVGGGAVLDDDPNVLTAAEMQVVVGPLVTPTLTVAARDLPPIKPGPPDLDREGVRRDGFGFMAPDVQVPPHGNPLVDLQRDAPDPAPDAFGTPVVNVAGVQSGSSPPDDTGDVGPNHFVQGDNGPGGSRVTVYDKSGTQVGQFLLESLAPDSPCNTGYCDPTVVYDALADRWFINEFSSVSSYPFCLYVSQTSDPLGEWYYYTWDLPYYDYPKYGLWPDAYYMGYNGGPTGYRQVFAFDRAKMVAGQAATYQMFQVPSLSGLSFQMVMPATLEGSTSPPVGAPGIFMRPRDTEVSGGTCTNCDLMEMWEFHVDWTTPANSTLTKLTDVQMTDYDCTLCGTGSTWDCMPQPGTTQKIDPIREPLHYQLQYRNFGTHETLVGCFVEDVDGSDHAAVRWFEIRRTPPGSGSWGLYQNGTLGGEASVHRSVCSAAMDSAGNIAVGYTRTGNNAPYYPSIYYSGRLAGDPLGTMPYYDNRIWDATTSKTNNERWGDYSGIGVDPVDDCTFWYTTEYGGSGQTRIAAFKFDECGVADFTLEVTPESLDICAGEDAVYEVSVGSLNGFGNGVNLSSSGRPAGTTESFVPNPVTPAGSSSFTIGSTGGVAAGTYNVTVGGTAQDSPGHQDTVDLNVHAAVPGAATLSAPADGSTGVALAPSLTWGAVSGAASYDVQVATDPDFANVIRSATGLTSAGYTPSPGLEMNTVYYWRVRAANPCGPGGYSDVWTLHTVTTACTTYGSGASGLIDDATGSSPAVSSFDLDVPDTLTITDLDVLDLEGTHPDIDELTFALQSPAGPQVTLIPRMCTGGANFDKDLNDEAAGALACPLSDGAVQRPYNALSAFDLPTNAGTWVLRITNYDKQSEGYLNRWYLRICSQSAARADYGDLATSYGIAWHAGEGTLRLGAAWSADDTFSPPPREDDSDDGVSFPFGFQTGPNNTIRVNVQGLAANGRWVRIWFDWDDDKVFDDAELVYDGAVALGDNDLAIVGPGVSQPVNYRVRLYDSAGAPPLGLEARDADSYGGASSGEVEDGTAPAPTAVKLVSFAAAPAAQGILVTWETASEDDNAGFNLYRSDSPAVLGQLLNGALIPSPAPGGGQGAAYAYLDGTAAPGATYYYTLEAVDLYDGRARYGPAVTGFWRAYLPVVPR